MLSLMLSHSSETVTQANISFKTPQQQNSPSKFYLHYIKQNSFINTVWKTAQMVVKHTNI